MPGSQLLLLALLQGWGWDGEVLLAPCHHPEHGHGAAAPNLEGSCQVGFAPCQEHVWVRGDPLPEPLRSMWQGKLQGCL